MADPAGVGPETVYEVPPPLPLDPDSARQSTQPIVHDYGPHPNTEKYIRFLKMFFGGLSIILLLIWFGFHATALLLEGTLSSDAFLMINLPTLAVFYVIVVFGFWPRYLRSQKVTLTDTHLCVERKTIRRQVLRVPRTSIFKVNKKVEKTLSRYGFASVYVYTRDRSLPWHVRFPRSRIRIFGLDRPDHLRKQLLEPDESDEAVPLDERSVVSLEQESPTWTRQS